MSVSICSSAAHLGLQYLVIINNVSVDYLYIGIGANLQAFVLSIYLGPQLLGYRLYVCV